MNAASISGMDVDAGHISIGGLVRRHREAAVHVSRCRSGERLGIRNDEIRFAESPAAVEIERTRKLRSIALRRTRVHPPPDRVDLVL
jgi:hypothetical protein